MTHIYAGSPEIGPSTRPRTGKDGNSQPDERYREIPAVLGPAPI
jgi:hypothetical protein